MPTTRIALALLGSLAICLASCSKETKEVDVADQPADTSLTPDASGKTDGDPKASSSPAARAPARAQSGAQSRAGSVTLTVRGLHCEDDCVPRLTEMLAAAPGVTSVAVDYAAKTATVAISGDVAPERVAAAVGGGFVAAVK